MDAYLSKPLDRDELATTLARFLRSDDGKLDQDGPGEGKAAPLA